MKKKISFLLVAFVLVLLLCSSILMACQTPSSPTPTPAPTPAPSQPSKPAEVIIIKGITDNPTSDKKTAALIKPFIESVNKQLQGVVELQWIGGAEVVGMKEQSDAVRKGVMQMQFNQPRSRTASVCPLGFAGDLSALDGAGERKSGAFDAWSAAYEKYLNSRYLGLTDNGDGSHYYLFLTKKIEKLSDFKPLQIRFFGAFDGLVKALGASPVALPLTDVYTAMQRGVVDGCITNPDAAVTFSLGEVTKYTVDPGFLQMSAACYMNMDTWNSLPKNAQDVIFAEALKMEQRGKQNLKDYTDKAWVEIEAGGMQWAKLSADEGKKLIEMATDVLWDFAISKDPSGEVAKLRPLMK